MKIIPPQSTQQTKERMRTILKLIERQPENWNQEVGHCGTSHCFAGFAECLAYDIPVSSTDVAVRALREADLPLIQPTREVCRQWLGISEVDSQRIFRTCNTQADLLRICEKIVGEKIEV